MSDDKTKNNTLSNKRTLPFTTTIRQKTTRQKLECLGLKGETNNKQPSNYTTEDYLENYYTEYRGKGETT
jgi:hypothetical protein